MNRLLSLSVLLSACGPGTWNVTTWGEEYIEDALPSDIFADDCTVTYESFHYGLVTAELLDGNGDVAGSVDVGTVWDLTAAGPHDVGSVEVPATTYTRARFQIAPGADAAGNVDDAGVAALAGAAVRVVGSVTCGEDVVTFDWSFDTDTTYVCEPDGLTIAAGGDGTTELTVHGDHLFYDGLSDPEAAVRGQAIVDADADDDGVVTLEELAAVPVAPLGYSVGPYSDVEDLRAFVTFLTRTLGHVDGEGHCQVDL